MKLTSFAFFLLLVASLSAQSAENQEAPKPDQRLYDVYGTTYINNLLHDNPFLIKRWNYYLDHAFTIIEAVPGKTDDHPEVTIENLDNINILLLEKEQGLTHDHNVPVIYNIKSTNKCLVYLPGKKFAKAFRELETRK